jgi:hypothetical protein
MHFPSTAEGTMYLWYFVIAGILLGLLIGLGYAYSKILKKSFRKLVKWRPRPKKADSAKESAVNN